MDVVNYEERVFFDNHQGSNLLAVSWWEQVTFWWDDDDGANLIRDQHAWLAFYSVS